MSIATDSTRARVTEEKENAGVVYAAGCCAGAERRKAECFRLRTISSKTTSRYFSRSAIKLARGIDSTGCMPAAQSLENIGDFIIRGCAPSSENVVACATRIFWLCDIW